YGAHRKPPPCPPDAHANRTTAHPPTRTPYGENPPPPHPHPTPDPNRTTAHTSENSAANPSPSPPHEQSPETPTQQPPQLTYIHAGACAPGSLKPEPLDVVVEQELHACARRRRAVHAVKTTNGSAVRASVRARS